MKLKMFTVYDSKVEAYLQPFYMQSKGEALRAWGETVNDEKSNIGKHPADYTLFELGEYDNLTGQISQYEAKIALGTGIEFKTI